LRDSPEVNLGSTTSFALYASEEFIFFDAATCHTSSAEILSVYRPSLSATACASLPLSDHAATFAPLPNNVG
jgi:hypothetical protein